MRLGGFSPPSLSERGVTVPEGVVIPRVIRFCDVEPGGFTALSRWLSAATPPDAPRSLPHLPAHPGGMPATLIGPTRTGRHVRRPWLPSLRDGTGEGCLRLAHRWCRRCAPQPPAKGWEPCGFQARPRRDSRHASHHEKLCRRALHVRILGRHPQVSPEYQIHKTR